MSELNELLDQLKSNESLNTLAAENSAKKLDLNDANVNDFILKKAGKLVEDGLDSLDAIKQTILTGFEPEELTAYADLIKSVTQAIDTLNKINIQNKKNSAAKDLKNMDIEARKTLPEHNKGNTNILIATREEIFNSFLDKHKDAITVDSKEMDEEDENTRPKK